MNITIPKTLILVMSLMTHVAISAPINRECEINLDPSKKDCTNDPFMTTWEMDFMNFSYAWDKAYGTSRVAIIDEFPHIGMVGSNEFSRIRLHDSGNYGCFNPHNNNYDKIWNNCILYNLDKYRNVLGFIDVSNIVQRSYDWTHGDLILSMFSSVANNGIGMPSICRECSISFNAYGVIRIHSDPSPNHPENQVPTSNFEAGIYYSKINLHKYAAFNNAILNGSQVINLSGYLNEKRYPNCNSQQDLGYYQQPICQLLKLSKDFDITFVASNGNDFGLYPNWPANDIEYVIGVGGSDRLGNLWQKNPCSDFPFNCGTQLNGPSMITAPAKDIILYHHSPVIAIEGCGPFSSSYPNYIRCSGTSFSAPIISGIVSIIRSLNPLISFDETKHLLANSRVYTDNETGYSYSIPNIMQIMTKQILGNFNGNKIANRLKPMFRLNTRFYHDGQLKNNYLSTSIPQVAATAMKGYYLADVNQSTGFLTRSNMYHTDDNEKLALGYPKFREPDMDIKSENARAPFYIFGGHENPFTGEDDMIPLHHFALKPVNSIYPECHDLADHVYGSNRSNAFLNNAAVRCVHEDTRYVWEGIEGYLLPECPQGQSCYEENNDPEAPQCLMLRYSSTDNSYALVMESELQKAKFSSYTGTADHLGGMSDSECLGYVYPNVDSDNDLIIDGMELVLGTDPYDNDTDNDGVLDGVEYPPTSPIVSNPLDPNSF